MDYFDFAKVRYAMKAMEWKVSQCDDSDDYGIPYESFLRKTARQLLISAYTGCIKEKSMSYSVSTMGFKATYYAEDKDGPELFQLEFIITEWSE